MTVCPLLWLDLGTCTLLTLPTPGVDISGAAGPHKTAGQHASGGTYSWVCQAVYAVEDQAAHGNRYQRPHYTPGEITPDGVAVDQHILCIQLGT